MDNRRVSKRNYAFIIDENGQVKRILKPLPRLHRGWERHRFHIRPKAKNGLLSTASARIPNGPLVLSVDWYGPESGAIDEIIFNLLIEVLHNSQLQ